LAAAAAEQLIQMTGEEEVAVAFNIEMIYQLHPVKL
jgi:hypothetical protein